MSQDKTEQLYFDGTGYGTVNITQSKTRRRIEFSVKSSLRNALLFYIGNEVLHGRTFESYKKMFGPRHSSFQ